MSTGNPVATRSEIADIAVLQSQMAIASESLARIEAKLDTFNTLFVTKAEFGEFKQRWFLSHTLSAVFGGVLTGICVYVFTQIVK